MWPTPRQGFIDQRPQNPARRNDMLRYIAYPDSSGSSDRVAIACNRQGQERTRTDQRGTIRTFYYDKLGRLTNDCVTTVERTKGS